MDVTVVELVPEVVDPGDSTDEMLELPAFLVVLPVLVLAVALLIRGVRNASAWAWRWRRPGLQRGPVLAPSPPPLATLASQLHAHEDDPQVAFGQSVEVINLITPPSDERGSKRVTPLHEYTPAAGPSVSMMGVCGGKTPGSAAPTATPVRRRLGGLLGALSKSTPAQGTPSVFCTPASTIPAPPEPEPQEWDPALLAASAAQERYMTSVEGLYTSREFQTHIRSQFGNLDRHLEQVSARLGMYRLLRAVDRGAFMHALTRTRIADFESLPVPRVLQLLDTFLTGYTAWAAAWCTLAGQRDAAAALTTLLVLQAVAAWPKGHPSLLGWAACVYAVQPDPRYPEHLHLAPVWRLALAGLIDGALTCVTFGLSGVLSALLVLLSRSRQTLGQACARITCVREVATGVAGVPPRPPPMAPPPPLGRVQRAGADRSAGAAGAVTPLTTQRGSPGGAAAQRPHHPSPPAWQLSSQPGTPGSVAGHPPASPTFHPAGSAPSRPASALHTSARPQAGGASTGRGPGWRLSPSRTSRHTPGLSAPPLSPPAGRTPSHRSSLGAAAAVAPSPVGWTFGSGVRALPGAAGGAPVPGPSPAPVRSGGDAAVEEITGDGDALLFSVEHRVWCSPSVRQRGPGEH